MHNIILSAASEVICVPLTNLFNRSLTECKFCSIWEIAHVTPIYKKGDKQKCKSYCPISLLSCIGKILEKCVKQHVFKYLTDNNLFTESQSGFIPKDSTVFQLTCIYDDFCKFLDSKQLPRRFSLIFPRYSLKYGTKDYCTKCLPWVF